MKIYLLRHAQAEDAINGMSDRERKLTAVGRSTSRRIGLALKQVGIRIDRVVTSPYPRSEESARIIAEVMGLSDRLSVDKRLEPGFRFGDLQELVQEDPETNRWMLVGHNPDMPMVASQLTGGSYIDMKKGGTIRVDTEHIEPGQGVLEWVVTPGILTSFVE